jgi:hypothetical protein
MLADSTVTSALNHSSLGACGSDAATGVLGAGLVRPTEGDPGVSTDAVADAGSIDTPSLIAAAASSTVSATSAAPSDSAGETWDISGIRGSGRGPLSGSTGIGAGFSGLLGLVVGVGAGDATGGGGGGEVDSSGNAASADAAGAGLAAGAGGANFSGGGSPGST